MFHVKIAALALAAGGAGLLGAGAYQVHARGGFGGHGRHEMMHKFAEFVVKEKLDEIGATEAQKQKVLAIKDRLIEEGHALRGERETFKTEMIALLSKDDVDAAQVKAVVHERIDAFSRFADDAADALVELHGVLTPQQRQKLLADLQDHLARHRRN